MACVWRRAGVGLLVFSRITFPLLRPILLIALLFRTLDALRASHTSFALPLMVWLLAGFIRAIPEEIQLE